MPVDVFWLTAVAGLTAFTTIMTIVGMRWLWRKSPDRESAEAMNSLLNGFVATSLVVGGAAFGGWWFSGELLLWGAPLPFLGASVAGKLYMRSTFGLLRTPT